MRVGREGADSTIDNALSRTALGLTQAKAQGVAAEVARVASGWRAHFKRKRDAPRDIQLLGEQIDRPFLRGQRAPAS